MPSILSESEKSKIAEILKSSKTIVIVGLSPDESKDSNMVGRYLQTHGYKIVPIYPKEDEILGEKVYRSLAEVPFEVDIVDVFRKGDALPAITAEALKLQNIKCIWGQIGCESDEAKAMAGEAEVFFVHGHCIKIEHARLV